MTHFLLRCGNITKFWRKSFKHVIHFSQLIHSFIITEKEKIQVKDFSIA